MGRLLTQQVEEPVFGTTLPVSRLVEFTKLGRDPLGKAGDIPDHFASHSAVRVGIRRRKCKVLGAKVLVLLRNL